MKSCCHTSPTRAIPTTHRPLSFLHAHPSSLPFVLLGSASLALLLYFIQAAGMQSWTQPFDFFADRWYFLVPLIAGFGIQVGLFHAIHRLKIHGGAGALAVSGGTSTGGMIACCMHNFIPLLPVLGASGLAAALSRYQTEIFSVSLFIVAFSTWTMVKKYRAAKATSQKPA